MKTNTVRGIKCKNNTLNGWKELINSLIKKYGPDAILSIDSGNNDAQLVVTFKVEEIAVEELAQKLYIDSTDNIVMHCNRYPAWYELDDNTKDKFRETARNKLSI